LKESCWYVEPKEKMCFFDGDKRISLRPHHEKTLAIDCSGVFRGYVFKQQRFVSNITEEIFFSQIAPARTFGFLDNLPLLQKHMLGQGTTLGNTVVVGDSTTFNEMRFDDEFIRHKVLDLIGDLYLLGMPLCVHIEAHQIGHSVNRLIVQDFIEHPEHWKVKKV
jgi:UDP-3-O-[3-hydroxymyristoyl] N-acetylglucosamine deacetylase